MRRRFLASVSVLAVVVAAIAMHGVSVAGQAPTPAAKAKAPAKTTAAASARIPPKTSWGDPDLQGIWNVSTGTPLQRPEKFGDKTVLAESEVEQVEEELSRTQNRDNRDGGAEAQVIQGYNDFWTDPRRREVLPDRRSSLIVDPPNGRIPPLVPQTPEVAKMRAARAAANVRVDAGRPDDPEDFGLAMRCVVRNDRPPHLGPLFRCERRGNGRWSWRIELRTGFGWSLAKDRCAAKQDRQ